MNHSTTAYHARWVLPIASAPIAHGAVVVHQSKLTFVGASADAVADRHVHLGNAALMPGLVNAHSHLELTVLRGFLEGLDFRQWLRALTDARRDVLNADSLLDSATLGLHEGLLAGVTTYGDATDSGAPLIAMRNAGVRGIGYLEVFGPDAAVANAALSGLQQRVAAARTEDTALVHTGISPHAPYTVSAPLFRAVAEWAQTEQLSLSVHVAESRAEVEFVRHGTGPFADRLHERGIAVNATHQSPIELLAGAGVLAPNALLVHCVHLSDDDIQRIADSGCSAAHCPISNAKLGHGIAPLGRLLNAGIPTGLGTDSVVSNNRMDMLSEARHASLMHSIESGRPDSLSASDALRLATIGGATALGLGASIGTLEVGKEADLTAFSLDRIEALPVFDPAVTLVHAMAGAVSASLVMVAGRELVRDGRVLAADESLTSRVRDIGDRLLEWRSH